MTVHNGACLWTDGRYYLQASKELDENWTLQKAGMPDTPTQDEWLCKVLPPKSTVAIDPKLFTVGTVKSLRAKLENSGHKLESFIENLVDLVWTDKPSMPKDPIKHLDIKYTGKTFETKLGEIRENLASKNQWGTIVSSLDEIAWLFNLRGSDV